MSIRSMYYSLTMQLNASTLYPLYKSSYLLTGDQVISLARSPLRPLKAATLFFFSLSSALWLTCCSFLNSGRVCDCSSRLPGSNGNISLEEFASGDSWSAVINTIYSRNSNVLLEGLHNGFWEGQNKLWSKAFLLCVSAGKPTFKHALVLFTFSQGKTLNKSLHLTAVCPVHCVLWGYMSVAARPDLAKAQQHLRQWTNPGLSRSETQRAGLRALYPPPLPPSSSRQYTSTLYVARLDSHISKARQVWQRLYNNSYRLRAG